MKLNQSLKNKHAFKKIDENTLVEEMKIILKATCFLIIIYVLVKINTAKTASGSRIKTPNRNTNNNKDQHHKNSNINKGLDTFEFDNYDESNTDENEDDYILEMNTNATWNYHHHRQRRIIPDEQRLISMLLKNYDPAARPVFNASKPVVVKFGFLLIQICDMVKLKRD